MTTSVVLARGSDWGNTSLSDGWGPDTSDDAIAELGIKAVESFQAQCSAKGVAAYWFPHTSEVIGDADQDIMDGLLNDLRDQAIDDVWQAFLDSDDACVICGKPVDYDDTDWHEADGGGDICGDCYRDAQAEDDLEEDA